MYNILKQESYIENNDFSATEYYKNIIGVTVNQSLQTIKLFIDKRNAPYIETNPLHQSQKILEKSKL